MLWGSLLTPHTSHREAGAVLQILTNATKFLHEVQGPSSWGLSCASHITISNLYVSKDHYLII